MPGINKEILENSLKSHKSIHLKTVISGVGFLIQGIMTKVCSSEQ